MGYPSLQMIVFVFQFFLFLPTSVYILEYFILFAFIGLLFWSTLTCLASSVYILEYINLFTFILYFRFWSTLTCLPSFYILYFGVLYIYIFFVQSGESGGGYRGRPRRGTRCLTTPLTSLS